MRLTRNQEKFLGKGNYKGEKYIIGSNGVTSKQMCLNKLGKLEDLEEKIGCPLEVRERALNGFYIVGYGYVSNDEDFIYLRKDNNGYYLKVVIHPSKPTPPDFYGCCDIHYLRDYKKTWWLKENREE